ncbi:MAG TPA: hypothetical protein VGU24_04075 [Microvirga sp.]|jgi:hypothetical protein|nr:hypothetical protein [Microvirga sp.]
MTLSAPLVRGLAVVALGATLALSHIAFAAAAPGPSSLQSSLPSAGLQKASDVETTASVGPRREMAENCYVDTQVVKGLRGKPVVLRVEECD